MEDAHSRYAFWTLGFQLFWYHPVTAQHHCIYAQWVLLAIDPRRVPMSRSSRWFSTQFELQTIDDVILHTQPVLKKSGEANAMRRTAHSFYGYYRHKKYTSAIFTFGGAENQSDCQNPNFR